MRLRLDRWWENGSVFKIARTKIYRYLRIIWVIFNVFMKQSITAIENLRFEVYFRFSRIQAYRIFYFLRRLFAKHQTLSS